MSRIRSKDTTPEIRVRKFLHANGFRYRLHHKDLPGKPDIVLSRHKTIVDVRGCFWHQHSCVDGAVPKTATEFWSQKFERTAARDVEHVKTWKALGYQVIIIWECECQHHVLEERLGDLLTAKHPKT